MTDLHSVKQWALTGTFCDVQGTLWLSRPVTYSDAAGKHTHCTRIGDQHFMLRVDTTSVQGCL